MKEQKIIPLRKNGINFNTKKNGSDNSKVTNNQPINEEKERNNPAIKLPQVDIVEISPTKCAYGIWSYQLKEKGKYEFNGIYRDGLYQKLNSDGFYNLEYGNNRFLVQIVENKIRIVKPEDIKQIVNEQIRKNTIPHDFHYKGVHIQVSDKERIEKFLKEFRQKIDKASLGLLPKYEGEVIGDIRGSSYFCYNNCVVKVSASQLDISKYEELEGKAVFEDQIIPRDFTYVKDNMDCKFAKFINNVANSDDGAVNAFRSSLGYLSFNFTEQTDRYIVIAYDGGILQPGRNEGGRGKGILSQALQQVRKTKIIDGKSLDIKNRFLLQGVGIGTQIIVIDDIRAGYPFSNFYSLATEGVVAEAKFKDPMEFPIDKNPKIFITSNKYLQGIGHSDIRRQFILLLSDYYSRKVKKRTDSPIKEEHKGVFFTEDWSEKEWNKFYSYMIDCAALFHKEGLHEHGWPEMEFNQLAIETSWEFADWSLNQFSFSPGVEYYIGETRENFDKYIKDINGGEGIYQDKGVNPKQFNSNMKVYAKLKGFEYKDFRKSNRRGFILIQRS